MKFSHLVIGLGVIFWPLSLFLANTPADFISYALPLLLLILILILARYGIKFHLIPLFFIPLIEPKLAVFPLLFALLNYFYSSNKKKSVLYILVALLALILAWNTFRGQTIFVPDYEAQQKVIRKTQLYPSVITARLFQNKARIVMDKFTDNFFALSDPNNYFFGFAPRQIVGNQNLFKYSVLSMFFFLYGLFHLKKHKEYRLIINFFIAGTLSLSFLSIYDRHDLILWLPVSMVFVHGVNMVSKKYKKRASYVFIIFVLFSFIELVRILVHFNK